MPDVVVHEVSKRFGAVRAVDGVSLVVADGRLLTLLGPSGCGKTTTLRMVAGLEHNDAGRIGIGDRVVSDPAAGIFVPPERREVGMVFQSYAIWPHMTVFANVAYPLEVRRRPAAEVRERVLAALGSMEMAHLAERPATALSGGQQQRVAIARALVFHPRVLLMDEPLSNLDAKLREQMRVELRALQQRLGITTLYVTHDQAEAMVISDRIAVLERGRVAQVGTADDLFYRPRTRFVAEFIGKTNVVDGMAVKVDAVSQGPLTFRVATNDRLVPGSHVALSIRPHQIAIVEPGVPSNDGATVLRGTIQRASFLGETVDYQVAVEGSKLVLRVATPAMGRLRTGETVGLRIERDACVVLAEA